jgi:hypothetical protein
MPQASEYSFFPRPVPVHQRQWGNLSLLQELGSGSNGVLFLALDSSGAIVAVKFLREELAESRLHTQIFRQESTIAASMDHPNISAVHDLLEFEGQLAFTMEYIHGESLSTFIEEIERLPIEVALHLTGQACLGLHALHTPQESAAVHANICPNNLLVSYDGELKIVDFGAACAPGSLTQNTTAISEDERRFWAPEQLQGSAVDIGSDIFSLGKVLVEMLHGAGTADACVADELNKVDLPASVSQIINKALAPEIGERYPSASAMYRDIYAALGHFSGMPSKRKIGDLMRSALAHRFARREEILSLAFSAPQLLPEEDLALDHVGPLVSAHRCEYCAMERPSAESLAAHLEQCSSYRWWKHNFAGDIQSGDVALVRKLSQENRLQREANEVSIWTRIKDRFRATPQADPMTLRLQTLASQIAGIRDAKTDALATRSLEAIWVMVDEISNQTEGPILVLAQLKPNLIKCADQVCDLALAIEAKSAYLASLSQRQIQSELDALRNRFQSESSQLVKRELHHLVERKELLLVEERAIREKLEVLRLRLEAMTDSVETTRGKILQLTSGATLRQEEARSLVAVFLDSLATEVSVLSAAINEVETE